MLRPPLYSSFSTIFKILYAPTPHPMEATLEKVIHTSQAIPFLQAARLWLEDSVIAFIGKKCPISPPNSMLQSSGPPARDNTGKQVAIRKPASPRSSQFSEGSQDRKATTVILGNPTAAWQSQWTVGGRMTASPSGPFSHTSSQTQDTRRKERSFHEANSQ